ncbi:MAG TPA: FHA domain-containing protein [Planctomycetota bacterium]|nr:FHA domain-containing protein [Planctomycetota bacterium]
MAFLKVYVGGTERTVFLGDAPVVIGRDAECDIPIPDLKISRRHCVIEPADGGGWRVRDLRSGNGTRVNGREVESRDLAREDVLEVGDAKVLFAGEAAAVVAGPAAPAAAAPRGPARKRAASKRIPVAYWLGGGGLALAALVLFLFLQGLGSKERRDPAEEGDYRAVAESRADLDRVKFGEMFLARYPRSAHAAEVEAAVAAARERLQHGEAPGGYDPRPEILGLRPAEAVARLEKMLTEAPEERRPAIRAALEERREALAAAREAFFAERLLEFRQQIEAGEYARAREAWFFLRGEPDWEPIPPEYASRIVDANRELGNAAAAERARLLEDEARYEAAHDFAKAAELLSQALPRFKGTGVDGSLRDRLDALERVRKAGPSALPPAQTLVRIDVGQKVAALLATFQQGDFAAAASGLRALAEEARKQSDPGFKELDARAGECEAAAALQAAVVTALGSGDLPKAQLKKRWRVISGGPDGVRVATRGEESDVAWAGMPADLHLALLEIHAASVARGWLGLAAAAQALGAPPDMIAALARAYEDEAARPAVDAFVAGRVRKEALPEGGYVVHEGELLPRKEFLRRQEEQQIAALLVQLDKAYAAIRGDPAFGKLDKLRKRKDELDVARKFALDLIFDEQKYFYPYRGTGREGEYQKVQQEVDRRVQAVEEIWADRTTVSVKASPELDRALKQFDEAAAGLRGYLVDVDEKDRDVAFLRSYLGKKFDLMTCYRTPEEKQLLDYTREVMEWNPTVEGDISPVEREQVEITNRYRIMFGRQPVRIVEKLVKAARGHSEEMSKIGYFSHFSPTPGLKTPWDRMKREGYAFGVSENIIQGQSSPMAAHLGWCHSSGHHRNILMPPWTEMGTGAYGNLMTQNYGQAPQWTKEPGVVSTGEDADEGNPWEEEGVPGDEGPTPEDEAPDYEEGD